MDLFIEILVGDSVGKRFVLVNGFRIGRKDCEILISDPKVSSFHASVIVRGSAEDPKYYLKDNNSSNGIKFNDLRVPELFLAPGVEFKLGNTVFKVVVQTPIISTIVPDPQSELTPRPQPKIKPKIMPQPVSPKAIIITPAKIAAAPPPVTQRSPALAPAVHPVVTAPAPAPSPGPVIEAPPSWRESLVGLLLGAGLRAGDIVNDGLGAFNPPLKLRCVRGAQYGNSWILGYGPRQIGPKSLDLVLNESAAPPICFQVMPTLSGVEFKTQHPDVVRLNGKNLTKGNLRVGDIISIFNTQLVVDFEHAGN